jgi:uncharacterized protein YxeA
MGGLFSAANAWEFETTNKVISGVVFGDTGGNNDKYIIGFYTSPVERVSQYNYKPTSSISLDLDHATKVNDLKLISLQTHEKKFKNGYYLSRYSKSIDRTAKTITYTFVVSNFDGLEDTVEMVNTFTEWSEMQDETQPKNVLKEVNCNLADSQFVGYIKDTYTGAHIESTFETDHEFKCKTFSIPKVASPLVPKVASPLVPKVASPLVPSTQGGTLPPKLSPGPIILQDKPFWTTPIIIGFVLLLIAIVFGSWFALKSNTNKPNPYRQLKPNPYRQLKPSISSMDQANINISS